MKFENQSITDESITLPIQIEDLDLKVMLGKWLEIIHCDEEIYQNEKRLLYLVQQMLLKTRILDEEGIVFRKSKVEKDGFDIILTSSNHSKLFFPTADKTAKIALESEQETHFYKYFSVSSQPHFVLCHSTYHNVDHTVDISYDSPLFCNINCQNHQYRFSIHLLYPFLKGDQNISMNEVLRILSSISLSEEIIPIFQKLRSALPYSLQDYPNCQFSLFHVLQTGAEETVGNIHFNFGELKDLKAMVEGRCYSWNPIYISLDKGPLHVEKYVDGSFVYSYRYQFPDEYSWSLPIEEELQIFDEEMETQIQRLRTKLFDNEIQ